MPKSNVANDTGPAITIIGATGLIGGLLLARLIAWQDNNPTSKIIVCARRFPESLSTNLASDKIEFIDINQADWQEKLVSQKIDLAFNCLGTTIKQAKSQQAFKQIDFDLVVSFAAVCQQAGAQVFSSVSALGAKANSKIFYSRIKGEVEQALEGLSFAHLSLFQPSLLLGQRQDKRAGEDLAKIFMPLLNPLMQGPLKDYQAIDAQVVADAMFYESGLTLNLPFEQLAQGQFYYKKRDMMLINKNFKRSL